MLPSYQYYQMATSALNPKPSPKSLTYIIRDTQHTTSHVLPIQSLCTSTNGSCLYTAGRDGVVSVYDSDYTRTAHIQLHSDWVNEVIPFADTSVVSCSSDLSVKWWNYGRDEHQLIGNHSDYVKCVTGLAQAGLVLSGGLDRQVKLWDVERSVNLSSFSNEQFHSEKAEGKGSVYSICSSKVTGLTAYGDNDGSITLLDPLNGQLIGRFTGHQGAVVRSLQLKDYFLLSGGADGSVRLWDLRTNAELEKWEFDDGNDHKASIWCCYSPQEVYDFSEFYCGDSQGKVTKVNAEDTSREVLTYVSPKGVLSLTSFQGELLSSSMANSDITNHDHPDRSIVGEPGLIKSRLLNDRRHVVTLSTNNEVNCWDIVSFEKSSHELPVNAAFEDVVDSLQTQDILPSWCRVNIKAGQLFVTLSESSFANVEVYGDDLWQYPGLENLDQDTRFNLGKVVLCTLLQVFVRKVLEWDADVRQKRIMEIKGEHIAGSTKTKLTLLTKFGNDNNSNDSSALTTPVDGSPSKEDTDSLKARKRTLSIFGSRRASKSSFTKPNLTSTSVPNSGNYSMSPYPPYNNQQQQQLPSNTYSASPTIPETTPISNPSQTPTQATSRSDTLRPLMAALETTYQSMNSQHLLQTSQLTPPTAAMGTPILPTPRPDLFLLINERSSGDSTTEIVNYAESLHSITKDVLVDELPEWIGNCILYDKVSIKETPKIGFVLVPEETGVDNPLPILRDDTRLSAYTMLRVRKILNYIVEKLDPKLVPEIQEMSKKGSALKPVDWLEVICQGEVVQNGWTLAMVRTRLWKGSGDVKFSYRRTQKSA